MIKILNEFQENIDFVIKESTKPVLIIGSLGDGKVDYLKNKYKTLSLNRILSSSNLDELTTNLYNILEPSKWYSNFLALCEEYKSDKCLIVFDNLGKVTLNVLSSIYQIILNEDGSFNLPENATIICTKNRLEAVEDFDLSLPRPLLECFTILDAQDKNNIVINWNNNKTR